MVTNISRKNWIIQTNVLAAWRWDDITYSGDARKMFNHILAKPEDQVFQQPTNPWLPFRLVPDLLGHKRNKETETFTFQREEIPETFTKRNCLALVAKLWDPIGITTPVTIRFRVDLQELWCLGFSWDDVIPAPVQKKWIENSQIMNNL